MSAAPVNLSNALALPRPFLLFIGELADVPYAKTAYGLRDWSPESCVGEFSCAGSGASIGLTAMTPREARQRGARALVIGVASIGGAIRAAWLRSLLEALEAGLDIISGLHEHLADCQPLAEAARRCNRQLIDVRVPPNDIPIATGRKRSGQRLLTVGTDCALGKKYTALCLARSFRQRGHAAEFRATGQTGILIAGSGIPIDSVVADFVAGAAELLSPDASEEHWDVIEGQGSLFHPSYAGVSLGLLHGSQPDVVVLCHEVGRERIMGLANYDTPQLLEAIDLNLRLGRRTNPKIRCAGVSLNTVSLPANQAEAALARCRDETGLPVGDPVRGGREYEQLVDSCLRPGT
jgi:uncharacterized NAD-dependent epimerase/dehydratase family protein